MKVDEPIVAIFLEGNVKDKVSTVPYTHIATYEAHRKETLVIITTDLLTRQQQSVIEKDAKKLYSKYGIVKSCRYYKDGADIIQMVTNN